MNLPSRFAALALLTWFCPAVHAGVLTVDDDGPAQYPGIAQAVAAAVDGDIILVKSGQYASFAVDGIGLTIEADTGAAVTLTGMFALIEVRNIPLGKTVTIRGIDVAGTVSSQSPITTKNVALFVHDNAGNVWIEDCEIHGGIHPFNPSSGTGAAHFENSDSVVIVNSKLLAGKVAELSYELNHGLVAKNTTVSIFGCTIAGGDSLDQTDTTYPSPGQAGVGIQSFFDSHVFLSGSTVKGGDGGDGLSGVWGLTHCTNGAKGAHAIVSGTTSTTDVHDSAVIGGTGGAAGFEPAGPSCSAGSNGNAFHGGTTVNLPGTASTLKMSSPAREGQPLVFTWSGKPGDVGYMVFGLDAMSGVTPTGWTGPLLLAPPYVPYQLGLLTGSGVGTFTHTVPELGPGLTGVSLFAQGVFVDPVTGSLTCSAPSRAVLLDSSL